MPDVYMSPTGSDSNTGLTAGSPVLTSSKVMTLLANAPGSEQNVFLRGGTYTSRMTFTAAKNGTAAGWITIRNYPGERAVIAPTTGTTQYTWEYGIKCSGSYWRIIAEAPSDRRDWSTYMIALDAGCTGVVNRTGIEYNPAGYTYTAGDFIRGMSCVQFQGNATAATIAAGTTSTGAQVVNVGARNSKKWGIQIVGYAGPTLVDGCLVYKAQMENIRGWYRDYGAAGAPTTGWGYGIGIIAGSTIYNDNLGTYLAGPHVIQDSIIDHVWGESVGCYALTDNTIQRNLVVEPHRMGIYNDACQRFQVLDNDVWIPSNPDISDFSFLWSLTVWSSEKTDKVAQNGLMARNRFIGGNQGIVYGFKKLAGANPNNILHAHNVCIGQSTRCYGSTGDALDNATVIFQNNVFDGAVEATTGNATWVRNAFANTPASRCLGGGGFVNATLGMLKATGLTKLGYTKEYVRPDTGSVLLQAGTAITTTPVGSIATDADGDVWDSPPTIGAFRSAVVDPAVTSRILALFFGGATVDSDMTINEVEVTETAGGADITGTASIKTTSALSNPSYLTDGNLSNAASATGDAAVLLTWSAAKTIAEIRLNVPATSAVPTNLSAYAVHYRRGMPALSLIGEWQAGERDSSGWLTFVVSPATALVSERARAAVESLF